jgi:hypothetical protein
MRQVDIDTIEIIRPERTVWAALLPFRFEYEVTDSELAAAREYKCWVGWGEHWFLVLGRELLLTPLCANGSVSRRPEFAEGDTEG